MCKVKKMYPLWGFLLSFPLWMVSCVDNKYDLDKDIDMTINVGGEHLTIPAGSSDTAYLSKIIEVEEGDILQPDAATRVYHLTKKDDIDVEPTTVKEVTISETTTKLEETKIVKTEGVSKCIPSFFMTTPRLSQAEALLLPKDFVSLSISKVIWQRYIFVLTIPIKSSFSHKE